MGIFPVLAAWFVTERCISMGRKVSGAAGEILPFACRLRMTPV